MSAIWLVLPEMGLSSYVIQEVLLYPIFLWTAYLVYLKFSGKESKLVDFGIIFLFVIMFFVKSFTISFAVAYFLALLICNGKKNIKKTIFQGIVFLGIVAIGYFGVYAINNFQVGTNHYSSQISRIFPITINTFINFAHGIWYYTVFFLFCTGILPIIMPIVNIKRYEEKDRKFIIFLMISAIMTIIETALIVFIPEESNKLYPHKFCYRYLLPIMIPFAIMLLKLKTKEVKRSFKSALKQADIKYFRFHDLRRTFATTLLHNGTNIKVIQHMLGHSSIAMTERYLANDSKKELDAVSKLCFISRRTNNN